MRHFEYFLAGSLIALLIVGGIMRIYFARIFWRLKKEAGGKELSGEVKIKWDETLRWSMRSHLMMILAFTLLLIFAALYNRDLYRPMTNICTEEAKLCPDGVNYVGRSGPKCEFAKCPDVQAIDISSWKTYRNEEYGFEFKYPAKWGDVVFKEEKPTGEIEILISPSESYQCKRSGLIISGTFSKYDSGYFGSESDDFNDCMDRGAGDVDRFSKFEVMDNWIKGLGPSAPAVDSVPIRKVIETADGETPDGRYAYIVTGGYDSQVGIVRLKNDQRIDSLVFGMDEEILVKILSTFKITDSYFKTSGMVYGRVSIGPLCPVEPCTSTIDPYSGKKLIFTPTGGGRPVDLPFNAPLNKDGSYSIELPESNYSVTLSECQYMGCSYSFPKNIRVEANKNLELNNDVDTGIR